MGQVVARASRALVAVLVVALVADALLGVLTGLLSEVGGGFAGPWWAAGHVPERSRWVVFGLLLGAVVRRAAVVDLFDRLEQPPAAWQLVGLLALVVPLLWTLSLWLVQATIFTVADRWDVDGLGYLSADYYRRVLAGYAPWLLGGAACLMASRHAS